MTVSGDSSGALIRSRFLRAVRHAWLLLVLGAVVWLVSKHGGDMMTQAAVYSPSVLVLSFACVAVGKWFVVLQMRLSFLAVERHLPIRDALYVYSVSDVSKYLPGGVWGILGRIGLYRFRGFTKRQIAVALLLENSWLVSGAFLIGATLSLETLANLIDWGVRWPDGQRAPAAAVALGILFLANMALCRLTSCRLRSARQVELLCLQFATWALFGLSFGILAPASRLNDLLIPATGAFGVAFGASLLSVFAPAGIGVREVVAGLLLQELVPLDALAVMAMMNRFVWIAADLVFAAFALSLNSGSTDRQVR